jgi:protein gp37
MLPPDWGAGYPNVWLGCTVTNQAEADRDVPKLLAVPAAVRFVSVEPMLGPMDLTQYLYRAKMRALDAELRPHEWMIPKLDLVICGGESGPKARPMHFDWVRGLRDQCVGAGVAFHFKQWGEWIPVVRTDEIDARLTMSGQNSDLWAWPDGISKDSWRNGPVSARVGTKRAGRTLDWRTWDEMPKQQEGIK